MTTAIILQERTRSPSLVAPLNQLNSFYFLFFLSFPFKLKCWHFASQSLFNSTQLELCFFFFYSSSRQEHFQPTSAASPPVFSFSPFTFCLGQTNSRPHTSAGISKASLFSLVLCRVVQLPPIAGMPPQRRDIPASSA